MESTIEIEESDLMILKEILSRYPYKFYVYGSRSKGYARRYSDIDLYCDDKITTEDLVNLKMSLEESNITIKVDVLDSHSITPEFKALIKKDLVNLNST